MKPPFLAGACKNKTKINFLAKTRWNNKRNRNISFYFLIRIRWEEDGTTENDFLPL